MAFIFSLLFSVRFSLFKTVDSSQVAVKETETRECLLKVDLSQSKVIKRNTQKHVLKSH